MKTIAVPQSRSRIRAADAYSDQLHRSGLWLICLIMTAGLWSATAQAVEKFYHTDSGNEWVCGSAFAGMTGILTDQAAYSCPVDFLDLDTVPGGDVVGTWIMSSPFVQETRIIANELIVWFDGNLDLEVNVRVELGYTVDSVALTPLGTQDLYVPNARGSNAIPLGSIQGFAPVGSFIYLRLYNLNTTLGTQLGFGTISPFESVRINVTEEIPCSVPIANLRQEETTSSSVTLSWAPLFATDLYRIYRNGGVTPHASVTETTFTDTPLEANTFYEYDVRGYNAAVDCESPSALLSFTTPPGDVEPASHDFGEISVGGSAARSFVIRNGTAADSITVASIMLSGQSAGAFTVSADTCIGVVLEPGGACTAAITFNPDREGYLSATAMVSFTTIGLQAISIPLSGGVRPVLVKDIEVGFSGSNPKFITASNGTAYFQASQGDTGAELWKSNGTESGAVLVKDINPGIGGSAPAYLTEINGFVYFTADGGTNGQELWKSDGTESGTVLVKDIVPGTGSGSPTNLIAVNGVLFFVANDGSNGEELWKSDGTTVGTVLVKDIAPGTGSGAPENLIEVNGVLYFTADDSTVSGRELWKSDGTGSGTVRIKDIGPGVIGSSPTYLTDVNGVVYFAADDGTNGQELWKTDGTESGTVQVKDINPGNLGGAPAYLSAVNGFVYFTAEDGAHGEELWRSDGTEAGTFQVKDIFPEAGDSSPKELIEVNGAVYFLADDGANGQELWKSDGTEFGTALVKDIRSGNDSSSITNLATVNGRLFFSANDGATGSELWESDGTQTGTLMVLDIQPGITGSGPAHLAVIEDSLYFTANDGVSGNELWAFDVRNTPPVLSLIEDQDTYDNNPIGPITFRVSDAESPVTCSDVTVTATSSNTALLPKQNLVITGTGEDCALTLTPGSDQTGTATVSITLSDGLLTASKAFVVEWWDAIVVGSVVGGAVEQTTIQAGLAAAVAGNVDTVVLTDGVYTGDDNKNIDFLGNPITITSENGPDVTVVDCQYSGQAFLFRNNETASSVIDGLTIQNCETGTDGGAVFIFSSSPTIKNSKFVRNRAERGGAIAIRVGSSPVISRSKFISNSAELEGGAIFLTEGSAALIEYCEFENNAAEMGGAIDSGTGPTTIDSSEFRSNRALQGGAVRVGEHTTVTRSSFFHNSALTGGALWKIRPGILGTPSPVVISNAVFVGNQASRKGGAIYGDSLDVINTSFYENAAEYGGAIVFESSNVAGLSSSIVNTLIWGNTSTTAGDQVFVNNVDGLQPVSLTIGFSILEGGLSEVALLDESLRDATFIIDLLGSILNKDPLFSIDGNLQVMAESPSIDSGSNAGSELPQTDFAGTSRAVDGDGDGTPVADIGAYEYDPARAGYAAVAPGRIRFRAEQDGAPPDAQSIAMRNISGGTTDWAIVETIPWLRVGDERGTVSGLIGHIPLYVDHVALDPGVYEGVISIVDADTGVLFRNVFVELNVNRTHRVPSEYTTIQEAIDAAIDGDVVLVADGIYSRDDGDELHRDKNLDPRGKAITIKSENGPQTTIIDSENGGQGFRLTRGETDRTIIDGFTVTGRAGVSSDAPVSSTFLSMRVLSNAIFGMSISGAASIRNSEFIDNPSSGLSLRNCDGFEVSDSIFTGNGQGIRISSCTNGVITNSEFLDNNGEAIWMAGADAIDILNSVFQGNAADQGAAIYAGHTSSEAANSFEVFNCLFSNNSASLDGGGIYLRSGSIANVTNSTFYNNAANQSGPGVYVDENARIDIINSILWRDLAVSGSDIAAFDSSSVTVTHSSVYGGWPGADLVPPQFLDPDGADDISGNDDDDFRLDPSSGCIDSGQTIPWLFSDIRGSVRPVDGNSSPHSPGAQFDRGAYEYSEYYGGLPEDLTAKALAGLSINAPQAVTGFEYNIEWSDRDLFRADPRIQQSGNYSVNLALVSSSGLRIDLLEKHNVAVSPLGYNINYTFGPEHIGTWRLRLELSFDPNQHVLSDEITIAYKEVTPYFLGEEITPPADAVITQKPDVDNESLVYWSPVTNRLFAIGPGTTVVTWYADETRQIPIPVVAQLSYPIDHQIHIADTQAVTLLAEGSRFDSVEMKYADNDASVSGNNFTATALGYAVLLFRDTDASAPVDQEVFEVVRTLGWNHNQPHAANDPVFPIESVAEIGAEVKDATHVSACGNGYVFFEGAFYDGWGESRAYDREGRQGPIFAVNRDLSGPIANPQRDRLDDLVVVWYQQSSRSGVCWPARPVRYDPEWPEDADTIVIASQLGSGALVPDIYGLLENMLIYDQPDPDLPGYNPNEEHSAFFTALGSEFPGVFPLRVDLNQFDTANQTDTSEPYVLLKYREPLSSEWNMKVFKIAAQSNRYRYVGGAITDQASDADRYCLNVSGQVIDLAACTPGARYNLDAEGHLVNLDDRDSCYQFDDNTNQISGMSCLPQDAVGQYYIKSDGRLEPQTFPATVAYSLDQHGVLVESDTYYRFHYTATAGTEVNPPYPLNQPVYSPCEQSYINASALDRVLKDKDDKLFAYQGDAEIKLHYFYKLQPGYFYDIDGDGNQDRTVGTCIPWLEGLDGSFEHVTIAEPGVPVETTYAIHWPELVPSLFVGETLIDAKTQEGESVGLPNIGNQCKVDVLYDEEVPETGNFNLHSVNLIDPLQEYASTAYGDTEVTDPEHELPQTLKPRKDLSTGRWVFTALPYHLQSRLTYDEVAKKVKLKGIYETGTGEPLLLMNKLSARDVGIIAEVMADEDATARAAFLDKVNGCNAQAEAALQYPTTEYPSVKDAELKALTAGDARSTGYVTLSFNDHEDCPAPTVLSVIRVKCPVYTGEIKVIESPNPFEEKVTLRHSGDFGGYPDTRFFQWLYRTADFSGIPEGPQDDPPGTWLPYSEIVPLSASEERPVGSGDLYYEGAVDTVIQGSGQQLLPDRWFATRYSYEGVCPGTISPWTEPQLYEGWLKRVMKKINLFDQKVTDFHAAEANTLASMVSLAGQRYEGDIALSEDPEYLQGLGIIEVYETLLNRGKDLTGEEGDFTDLNKALLFAANRVADLYMLLGNEAFADSVDPTIGFSTESGIYGTETPSIFSFQNQTASLIEEELALLRGRDEAGVRPFYNRLVWNFTLGDGEVAYKENYNITDQDEDGDIDEFDAMIQFPQGHGDAWGHYLSAVKKYYELLKRDNFTWIPQSEAILVAGTPVDVDYLDERNFASAAAARARTGAEIVNLTYRQHYTADPEGQWQGYKDHDPDRAWGVDGWVRRAGQGALFDWVAGNAMLPRKDPFSCDRVGIDSNVTVDNCHDGISKVDRSTVVDLWEVASHYSTIESEIDKADAGLNPLGLVRDAVPFDIDPLAIANGETHFEQIYGRAAQAMNNAIAVFNHANENSQLLRRQQDTLADFKRNVENQEADYNNRLVEVWGYPYPEDCGPGKTYPADYCDTEPDLFHYMYVDASELMGEEAPRVHEFTVTMKNIDVDAAGALTEQEKAVTFHVDTDSRFGIIKPPDWQGRRKAPGEIQFARSDLLQTRGRFEKAQLEYENLIGHIESQADLIEAQHGLNRNEIRILNKAKDTQIDLNIGILVARTAQLGFRTASSIARAVGDAGAEAVPTVTGFIAGLANGVIIDALAPARGAAKGVGVGLAEVFNFAADVSGLVELGLQGAKEVVSAETNIELTALRGGFAFQQQLLQLENLVRSEITLRHELYILAETLEQSANRYLAALARGDRLLRDRLRFRTQTAAQIQDYRYKDMTFRIFRNDALEKYRAQYDMAALYVYLAAKAYDYETTLLDYNAMAGQHFLTDIVRQRSIGQIENGQPLTGTGLADPMRRMWQNFQVLKPQLGFNNPQVETNRFSLRQERFRIRMDTGSNGTWRRALETYREPNLWDVPEYRRYCRPFGPQGVAEPGLVIPFSTTVTSGLNFFHWPLGGGDSYYSASNFATKVRSVGTWFSNYNSVGLAQTPRVYLVPAGEDVLRTPSFDVNQIRSWQVVDQKLPTPFPIVVTEMVGNPGWIPMVDTLYDEPFQIRRHSDFRAYHDSGFLNQSELQYDSRLIGRSVWNDRWLLIIPGRNLLYDPDEGLDTFIYGPEKIGGLPGERTGNGISDIKLFFETYSYSGN